MDPKPLNSMKQQTVLSCIKLYGWVQDPNTVKNADHSSHITGYLKNSTLDSTHCLLVFLTVFIISQKHTKSAPQPVPLMEDNQIYMSREQREYNQWSNVSFMRSCS